MVMVVLVLAGLAVLAAVVVLAMGRGGELGRTHPDAPPLPLIGGAPVTGPEVAMLRLPRALWGYQMNVTDEALHRLAYAMTERDTRVAAMELQIADLRRRLADAERPEGPEGPGSDAWAFQDEAPVTATDVPAAAPPHGAGTGRDLPDGGPDRPDGGSDPSGEDRGPYGGDDRGPFGGDGRDAFGGGLFDSRRELLENEKPRKL